MTPEQHAELESSVYVTTYHQMIRAGLSPEQAHEFATIESNKESAR